MLANVSIVCISLTHFFISPGAALGVGWESFFDWIIHSRSLLSTRHWLSISSPEESVSSCRSHDHAHFAVDEDCVCVWWWNKKPSNCPLEHDTKTKTKSIPAAFRRQWFWIPDEPAMWSLIEESRAVNWWVNPSYSFHGNEKNCFSLKKTPKNDLWMLISMFTRISIQDGIMQHVMKYGSFIEAQVSVVSWRCAAASKE